MLDDYDPALMFTIPRLAIVWYVYDPALMFTIPRLAIVWYVSIATIICAGHNHVFNVIMFIVLLY